MKDAEAQLGINRNKDPQNTELQNLFIQTSREREEERKRAEDFNKLLKSFGEMTISTLLATNAQEDSHFRQQQSVAEYNLRSILCVPLRIREETIGVIFIDSRTHSGLFQEDDIETLSVFANQAATAIDNARMFDELQQAEAEIKDAYDKMKEAYDETLQGWALASELKDRENEGHTQRATYLTLLLVEKFGIDGEEKEYIKWGALLHDIGNMAIPNSVLSKHGKLTPAERKFMELHPEPAKDMLEKIEFLHPAMDIPYCHHENGTAQATPAIYEGKKFLSPPVSLPLRMSGMH